MTEVQVRLRRNVPARFTAYAADKVSAALRRTAQPVLYARVLLERNARRGTKRPVTAHVEVDVNGRVVHANASAPTVTEAVDRMQARLRTRIDRLRRD